MRERALCPQMTAGMAVKMEKHKKLRIPKTRLQMARAEVLGAVGSFGAFMGHSLQGRFSLHIVSTSRKVNSQLNFLSADCEKALCWLG